MQISEISRYSANFDCIFVQKIFIFEQWLRLFFQRSIFFTVSLFVDELTTSKKIILLSVFL